MESNFKGWNAVATRLKKYADNPASSHRRNYILNDGQCASLRAIAERIPKNGIIIADEVGMGKTCIAVELARSVMESGGRVAILVPPGLGYQWHDELRMGDVDAPLILRSLLQYLKVWESEIVKDQQPWFEKQVVVISHAFTKWSLGETSDPWRWLLLPEFYAQWRRRRRTNKRFPNGYRNLEDKGLTNNWVTNAAKSICDAIPKDEQHPAWCLATELSNQTPWPGALEATEYGRNEDLRPWLESAVGLGLGVFDLVIVDEAHKSRRDETGLSRILNNVLLKSQNARILAMTATPVELDVCQWTDILSRIGLDEETTMVPVNKAIIDYSEAVRRIRLLSRNQDAKDAYKVSSAAFQEALSPYLLRRDKLRWDQSVQLFKKQPGLLNKDYRCESEIVVEASSLDAEWKDAVCAAEALSFATCLADDSRAKRLRLTLGNGHGISTLIDRIKRHESEDRLQEKDDQESKTDLLMNVTENGDKDPKRKARIDWWLNVMKAPFIGGDDILFNHPAIIAAVQFIEEVTSRGDKVLVFGRFTLPLQALVNLLNAREMLRCLQSNRLWPQSKVHEDEDHSDWNAVRAAHVQMQCDIPLEQIDQLLEKQYTKIETQRRAFRRHLIDTLGQGFGILKTDTSDTRTFSLFEAFKKSTNSHTDEDITSHPLSLVSRALYELLEYKDESINPVNLAETFIQLINALSDRDEGDLDGNGEIDEGEANKLWNILLSRLDEEYNRPQGGFARLMYGGTKQESRRMIQLAFNRLNSFPRVLVAQSVVGREGLNLHKACRTVVLLHPEWNPGVVEQQIGRVDRVGSLWATQLENAVKEGFSAENLPRIEVCPVIFKGTYDEYNWKVLRERWDDLRAQLHGIVIPTRIAGDDEIMISLIDEISKFAPNFSTSIQY
jgi:superfamily II DNA or RNA helicase